jgi:hypothetical protein
MFRSRALGHLLRLRYRLLWAQTRTRNGKLALFFTFYLFVILVVILVAAGGLGAALAAVRSGKAELVARIVLGGFFLNALMISVVMGFGMNSVFSDAALRRFPLSAVDRLAARQLIAFAEPLWAVVLSLNVGLAVGFYVLGVSGFWTNLVAAVLLAAVNYLLARVLLNVVERTLHTPAGTFLLLVFILTLSLAPAVAGPWLARYPAVVNALFAGLRLSPPFAAAAVLSTAQMAFAAGWLACLGGWATALLALLLWLESQPLPSRSIAKAAASWDSPYDRVAAWCGPVYGPLIGKTLRYYLRCNRVRYNYALAVPLCIFLTFSQARRGGPDDRFVAALSAFAILAFLGTAAMAVNQFGYDGGGFRRYFLLPGSPAVAFQASSFATLGLGAVLLPPGFLCWFAFAAVATTPRMLLMLVSSALSGLFLFNALSLWTTLYAPRRTSFGVSFGNNLSFGGNVLVMGGMLPLWVLPDVLRSLKKTALVYEYWWILPVLMVLAMGFYAFTLHAGAAVFAARKERLLGIMEGRE